MSLVSALLGDENLKTTLCALLIDGGRVSTHPTAIEQGDLATLYRMGLAGYREGAWHATGQGRIIARKVVVAGLRATE